MRIGLKTKTAFGAALVSVLAGALFAVLWLAVTHWFGVEDLAAFFVWSTPFAALVAVVSLLWSLVSRRLHSSLAYLLGAVIGLLSGWAWTVGVAVFLGP